MAYQNAFELLPEEIVKEIQKYVNGTILYIPKKPQERLPWGSKTARHAAAKKPANLSGTSDGKKYARAC